MIKSIFKDIIDRLSEVESLNYVSLDWGQLGKEQPAVKWPCALVTMRNCEFTQQGNHQQQGQADIIITVAYLHNAHMSANSNQTEKGLAGLEYIDEIHTALSGWHPDSFGYPERTALERVEQNDAGREVWIITYHIAFPA